MKRILFVALVMSGLACSGTKPAVKIKPSPTAEEDKFSLAMETFRHASQVPHFRKAIDLLNQSASFQQKLAAAKMSPEMAGFLDKELRLTKDEIQNAQADKFNGTDVYHLEECFYFRDLANHLDLRNFPPLDQVRLAWQWVTRQVPLCESAIPGFRPST